MNSSRLIGILVALALVLGLWAAFRTFPRRPAQAPAPAPAPTAAELADPGSDVVARAMNEAPAVPEDSSAIKNRWYEEVRGADLGGLDAGQREIFLRFANAERCTCGCGYTLAGCKASDMSCEVSGGMIDALLDSIRAGRIRVARGVRARPVRAG